MNLPENITFGVVEIKDSNKLYSSWIDNDVTKYTMIRNINSIDDCEKRIERQLKWLENDSVGPFVILENNFVMGYCGGTKEEKNEYEIFYHLYKDRWNKGLGTKIVKELISIGFYEKKANKIKAKIVIENTGSFRVLEKNGMKRIKLEKESFENNGRKYDMYVYEICKK